MARRHQTHPGQEAQQFCWLTRRLRRGRVDFDPRSVPEIVAFLIMCRNISADRIQALFPGRTATPGRWEEGVKAQLRAVETVCDQLVDNVVSTWGWRDWDRATTEASELLGVKLNEPLPREYILRKVTCRSHNKSGKKPSSPS